MSWGQIATELHIKEVSARQWALIEGWSELEAWSVGLLIEAEVSQLASAGLPVLEQLRELSSIGASARVQLDEARERNEIEVGEWALRMSQLMRAERDALTSWLDHSGWSKQRAAQVEAVQTGSGADLSEGPEPLSPEEERERALEIAKILKVLGGSGPND